MLHDTHTAPPAGDTGFAPGTFALQQNRRLLMDIAAWALSDLEVKELLPGLTPARLRQTRQKLNRDTVRVAMLVLSLGAMEGKLERFSIRKLARVLDGPRQESMQRSLRNWLLPLLAETGWIMGFSNGEEWSTTAHEISITPKGLAAVRGYFEKLAGDVS